MARKSRDRVMADLFNDSFVDSVVINLADILGIADDDRMTDILEKNLRPTLSELLVFSVRDGLLVEDFNLPAVVATSERFASSFNVDRLRAMRAFVSPLYSDQELTEDELIFMRYMIEKKGNEVSREEAERDEEEGKLEIFSLDCVLSSLLDKGVVNCTDGMIHLINRENIGRRTP